HSYCSKYMQLSKLNFVKKPVRSMSGVTVLTVVLKPRKCNHGTCIYCPGGDDVPQSYTDKSPAIMRAVALNYNPKKQVEYRLNALKAMNHPTDKIELIIIGGTFLQYDLDYQYGYIKACYDALNRKVSNNLEEAKKLNETSKHRIVALCIENRPDTCSEEDIDRMLEFGCTRVELGIQILDDLVYKKINRGHTVKDVVQATKRLKEAGFKVGYHVMPGLPGSNLKKDLEKFKLVFKDERFKPDQLKIYPCQVVEDSPLEKVYDKLKYRPYTDEETQKLIVKFFEVIPRYCRVMRIMREIPKEKMVGNIIRLDTRKELYDELKNKKVDEIRLREVGFNKENLNLDLKLKTTKYKASGEDEYFLEIVNEDDILFGLLRLRICSDKRLHSQARDIDGKQLTKKNFGDNDGGRDSVDKVAVVRELHVYGQALNLNQRGEVSQHRGFGKWLMSEAEKIAKENGFDKIKVISGVGVREYYRKLGYELDKEGIYMVKKV
ncbi:MAG: tRNA uridine(34) 5-carboxymethylaminomethyl modification radical SAM/GNAT enzyme Elp3, partial [Candidatus Nanoarchaeia archaeon]